MRFFEKISFLGFFGWMVNWKKSKKKKKYNKLKKEKKNNIYKITFFLFILVFNNFTKYSKKRANKINKVFFLFLWYICLVDIILHIELFWQSWQREQRELWVETIHVLFTQSMIYIWHDNVTQNYQPERLRNNKKVHTIVAILIFHYLCDSHHFKNFFWSNKCGRKEQRKLWKIIYLKRPNSRVWTLNFFFYKVKNPITISYFNITNSKNLNPFTIVKNRRILYKLASSSRILGDFP